MENQRTQRKGSYLIQKQSLWRRGIRRCYYCEVRLTLAAGWPHTMTLDHKEPLSRGGRNSPANYVPACSPCNNEKGSMTEAEYWAVRQRRARAERRARALHSNPTEERSQ